MYNSIIKNYINKLTINDIKNYYIKENLVINEKEILFIYNYIKKYNINLLNNPIYYLNDIKNKISNESYQHILKIYNQNKKKLI